MGSGSSFLSSPSSLSSSYRFGHAPSDADGFSPPPTVSLTWIGTSLELPPKPFSLPNYFQAHAVVGTGMLGKVQLVQHRKSRKFYALKSLEKKDVVARKMLGQLEAERTALLALTKLHHPFMARYFGSCQTSYHVHLLLEYVPGGELFRRLHDVGRFSNDEAKFYAAELVLFLECCHANGFMYRDLKPENILLDSAGHVRVIDFGFVKQIASADDRASTSVGTSQYIAPEVLTSSDDKQRGYTRAVDWWAWACVVYELVTGHTPFSRGKDDSPFELYTRIVKGHVAWPSRMDASLKDLLRKMLIPDAAKRLSDVEFIKRHPWFGNVDWLEVAQRDLASPHTPVLRVEGDHSNFDSYPNSAEEIKSPTSTYTNEFRNF